MATKKLKPAPAPAPKPAPQTASPAAAPAPPAAPESVIDQVRRQYVRIFAMYVLGHTLHQAGEQCVPPLSGQHVLMAVQHDSELRTRYHTAREMRATAFVDMSGHSGVRLIETGFHKEGGELLLKVAAKIAPALYGDKSTVALTGADGGAVRSVVELSPSEAYKRMLLGG